MPERFSPDIARRWLLAAAVLLSAWLAMVALTRQRPVPPARPLGHFPLQINRWRGTSLPLAPRILRTLRLKDYLNRVYIDSRGHVVGLYIAYYPRQRFGDDIHSPKNCLPGAGWLPLQSGALTLALAGRQISVNRYVVARGSDRELVLYWFQQQGRIIRSEYWSKAFQIWDGIIRRRSDAALVRIVVPVGATAARAQARGVAFVRLLSARLPAYLPN
jgi:EpsI family protein